MKKRLSPRLCLGLAAAAAIGFTPAIATAQGLAPAALSSASLAKSEAILGGSRSWLAEILAQHQDVSLPSRKLLQPASRRALSAASRDSDSGAGRDEVAGFAAAV